MSAPGALGREVVDEAVAVLNGRLRSHGGAVEVVGYDESNATLTVRFVGLCGSCPAWPMTLYATIRPFLREALGIPEVAVEDRGLSEAARRRIMAAVGS